MSLYSTSALTETSGNKLPTSHQWDANTKTIASRTIPVVLGAGLEVIIHEILYVRSLYPHTTFSPTRFLGVVCHSCRHSGVIDYVYNTLSSVIVPALCVGVTEELVLVIYDNDTEVEQGKIIERYVFEFHLEYNHEKVPVMMLGEKLHKGETKSGNLMKRKVQDLERSLRSILLKITTLSTTTLWKGRDSNNPMPYPRTATFKLCMRTPNPNTSIRHENLKENDVINKEESERRCRTIRDTDDAINRCPELKDSLLNGTWICSDLKCCEFTTGSYGHYENTKDVKNTQESNVVNITSRPLKSVHIPSCGFKLQLSMEFDE